MDGFYKSSHTPDGYRWLCKECDNRTRLKRLAKKRNIAIDWLVEYLKDKKCVNEKCGTSDPRVLQFDHLRDKEYEVHYMVSRGFAVEEIQKEIEKCQILCANCHSIKSAKHGKYWRYAAFQHYYEDEDFC